MDVCLRLFVRVVKKLIRIRPDARHFVYTCLLLFLPARAQFTITENFKGNPTGAAQLTSGVNDPAGQRWRRPTEDPGNPAGYTQSTAAGHIGPAGSYVAISIREYGGRTNLYTNRGKLYRDYMSARGQQYKRNNCYKSGATAAIEVLMSNVPLLTGGKAVLRPDDRGKRYADGQPVTIPLLQNR